MVVKGSVQAEQQTTRKKKQWYWLEQSSHLKWPTVLCKLYTQEILYSFFWDLHFFPSGVLMESAWWWATSQKVLTVAGRSGASGRPVPGRVVVESRAPTETVITRCKSHYSLKGYGVFISPFASDLKGDSILSRTEHTSKLEPFLHKSEEFGGCCWSTMWDKPSHDLKLHRTVCIWN